jgi:hypothetical protein
VTGSPVSGFFHLAHRPTMLSTPRSAALILAFRLGYPFAIAAGRDDAPVAFERVAEHGLVDDALRSSVEGSRQLLHRLFQPIGDEAPAHRDELSYGFRPRRDLAYGFFATFGQSLARWIPEDLSPVMSLGGRCNFDTSAELATSESSLCFGML